jgi:hypothetical protein
MVEFPGGLWEEMSDQQALHFLLVFLDKRPDDDHLCRAALTIGEPLIDWHWETIGEEFIRLAIERADVRKLVSCCDFDESVPEAFRERLYKLVRPEEDIGHQPQA